MFRLKFIPITFNTVNTTLVIIFNYHRSIITKSEKEHNRVDMEEHVIKFRDYLLFGHKKEGLEYAMQNGLWGHALFLASKMDERSYSNVMLRFANGLVSNFCYN